MASLFTEISDDIAKEEAAACAETSRKMENAEDNFDAVRDRYLEALRVRALEMQNDGNLDLNEADARFSTALNLSRVRNSLVAIIGAGGLGNWQWRILASMGFRRIAIYDDDNVGIENVGPQAHSIFDLDMPKVRAVENAALMYRGIRILARNRRVMSYSEICEDLGEDPDIVIGCTDSADFRNKFIEELTNAITAYGSDNQLPELFIDYRMSLGDWVAYIIPAKAMKSYAGKTNFCRWYKHAAVFDASEAVREPCTERAIAYTGANVASFTGALLHWFYSGGRQKFHDPEYMRQFADGCAAMPGRKVSFSSRDFEFITDTAKEKKLAARVAKMRGDVEAAWKLLGKGCGIPPWFQYCDSGLMLPEDCYGRYHGKLLVPLKEKNVVLCGFNRFYELERDDFKAIVFRIAGELDISRAQPYVVYDCAENDMLGKSLLQLLSAGPGEILRIGVTDSLMRVQRDYVERLDYYPFDSPGYARLPWTDAPADFNMNPVSCEIYPDVARTFDKLAREFEAKNAPDEAGGGGGFAGLGEDGDVRASLRLDRGDLVVGMRVTIGPDEEPLIILDIAGSHFKAQSPNGEETNYSLRRFPAVYRVIDE